MNNERLSLVNTKLPAKKKIANTPIPEKNGSCMEGRLYSPRDKFNAHGARG